ncbi:uncharacterized protein BcabD6B2_53100 [Babesia caballi]|uniref:Uncharacterized protein n=1 Tax=Babesia caballi TaxID=5871 RepID=A0AAV4M0Y1_BABCB|nr:hypothetical protein BcabD6B2_53100 [Babesia caballi]
MRCVSFRCLRVGGVVPSRRLLSPSSLEESSGVQVAEEVAVVATVALGDEKARKVLLQAPLDAVEVANHVKQLGAGVAATDVLVEQLGTTLGGNPRGVGFRQHDVEGLYLVPRSLCLVDRCGGGLFGLEQEEAAGVVVVRKDTHHAPGQLLVPLRRSEHAGRDTATQRVWHLVERLVVATVRLGHQPLEQTGRALEAWKRFQRLQLHAVLPATLRCHVARNRLVFQRIQRAGRVYQGAARLQQLHRALHDCQLHPVHVQPAGGLPGAKNLGSLANGAVAAAGDVGKNAVKKQLLASSAEEVRKPRRVEVGHSGGGAINGLDVVAQGGHALLADVVSDDQAAVGAGRLPVAVVQGALHGVHDLQEFHAGRGAEVQDVFVWLRVQVDDRQHAHGLLAGYGAAVVFVDEAPAEPDDLLVLSQRRFIRGELVVKERSGVQFRHVACAAKRRREAKVGVVVANAYKLSDCPPPERDAGVNAEGNGKHVLAARAEGVPLFFGANALISIVAIEVGVACRCVRVSDALAARALGGVLAVGLSAAADALHLATPRAPTKTVAARLVAFSGGGGRSRRSTAGRRSRVSGVIF